MIPDYVANSLVTDNDPTSPAMSEASNCTLVHHSASYLLSRLHLSAIVTMFKKPKIPLTILIHTLTNWNITPTMPICLSCASKMM